MVLSKTTIKILETANSKESGICGYPSRQIEVDFKNLLKGDCVEVGYRTSCGKTDKSHKVFKEWLKLIKSLKKDGFQISEQNITHPNKSPTSAHGFWNSIKYQLTNNQ